jgi:tRNA G18 (ribose-2'-O)-methylase SpoU
MPPPPAAGGGGGLHHPLLSHVAPGGLRRCQPLTVVASLISKATNLGGLARTCEIFAAEALVVPDAAAAAADASFAAVAVSAAEWMTLASVPPASLLPYLRARRAAGDAIVGLEQAARSSPLGDFSWTRRPAAAGASGRTVLVLGAELTGMPTDVIHACDDIVEITQLGVVRSMNVHVAAALCIFEYSRQRAAGAGGLGRKRVGMDS